MLENLEELEGLECETAAGDKSQSTSCLCCSVQPACLVLVAGFALSFLCNRPKLEGVLAERADDPLPRQQSRPRPHPPSTSTSDSPDHQQRPRPNTATCHALRTRRLSSVLPSNCAYLDPPSIQIRHSINLSCHDSRGASFPSGQGTMR